MKAAPEAVPIPEADVSRAVAELRASEELLRAAGPLRGCCGVVVAARAGGADGDELRAGDVIYAVNGVSVLGLAELRSAVAGASMRPATRARPRSSTSSPSTALTPTAPKISQGSAGAAYCWGRGESGQLGNGTVRSSASVPVAVTGSASFSSISVGVALACGLDANGYAYCWGGAPGIPSSPTPKAPPGNLRFRTISPGLNRTCGITTSGATYCWSWADSLPVEVHGAPDLVVISAGTDHVCGLTSAGIAYCWGNNRNGKLGMGNFIDSAGTPTKVATELRFTSIDAGVYHTCAVSADGDGYCWGSNIEWEVGDPTPGSWSVPRRVAGNIKFQSVSAGESYTCALGVDGGGYCWGADPFGNLGTGAPTDYRPRRVIGF